jgi:hypothetical protein
MSQEKRSAFLKVIVSVILSKKVYDFIHFWSATLLNTIRTTSFTPPSVIKLYLLFVYAFTCFGFLVNHLQKGHQLCKGNYHYMIYSYIKLVPIDFHVQVKM